MAPDVERLLRILDRLSLVVRGLRGTALTFAVASLLGAVLFWIGLLRMGAPWWLGILPFVVFAIPAFGLWRLRAAMEPALDLPAKIRSLPVDTAGLGDDFSAVAASLAEAKVAPKSPRAFVASIRATKGALDALNETRIGSVVVGALPLHPAGLAAGGVACLWAAAVFIVGLLMFLIGGLF